VRVKLDNPRYLLKPGMFASIIVSYPENKAMLSVPSASVIFDDNKYYVLRYKGKCNIEMQEISIYKTLNGRTYISQSNLQENDPIITHNGLYIFTDLQQM
jgi:cobalt-zinc-cadmium efflux system membrane fusion protein